jgi:hypothetical protein
VRFALGAHSWTERFLIRMEDGNPKNLDSCSDQPLEFQGVGFLTEHWSKLKAGTFSLAEVRCTGQSVKF